MKGNIIKILETKTEDLMGVGVRLGILGRRMREAEEGGVWKIGSTCLVVDLNSKSERSCCHQYVSFSQAVVRSFIEYFNQYD